MPGKITTGGGSGGGGAWAIQRDGNGKIIGVSGDPSSASSFYEKQLDMISKVKAGDYDGKTAVFSSVGSDGSYGFDVINGKVHGDIDAAEASVKKAYSEALQLQDEVNEFKGTPTTKAATTKKSTTTGKSAQRGV